MGLTPSFFGRVLAAFRGGTALMAKRKKRPAKRRAVRLPPEARAIVDRRRTRFKEEFGRDPQGNEPVFFDAAADESEPADAGAVLAALITAMKKAKVNPAKIHAVRRTGRIITRDNWRLLSPQDRAAWQAALEEYKALWKQRN